MGDNTRAPRPYPALAKAPSPRAGGKAGATNPGINVFREMILSDTLEERKRALARNNFV